MPVYKNTLSVIVTLVLMVILSVCYAGDKTTYSYDAAGNLKTIAGPCGGAGSQCQLDTDCAATTTYCSCATGIGQCIAREVLSRTFSLDQGIAFTGTSDTTGDQGPYVDVASSASSFTLPDKRAMRLCFDFEFWYPTGFSDMQIDVRFVLVLDGNVDTLPSQRFSRTNAAHFCQDAASVDPGVLNVMVQVRSVLVNGPPTEVRICGDSPFGQCYDPGITANLTASVIR